MTTLSALVIAMGLTMTTQAQHEHHAHHPNAAQAGNAQIVVTINPEARVSAMIGAPLPAPARCGSAIELKVKVVNRGFVTAPLRAAVVGDSARHVTLQMDGTKLSGQAEDSRALHLIPHGSDLVDVTVAFSIDNNIGDHGGHERVHLLVRCYE